MRCAAAWCRCHFGWAHFQRVSPDESMHNGESIQNGTDMLETATSEDKGIAKGEENSIATKKPDDASSLDTSSPRLHAVPRAPSTTSTSKTLIGYFRVNRKYR